jgi:hypothetical protein
MEKNSESDKTRLVRQRGSGTGNLAVADDLDAE